MNGIETTFCLRSKKLHLIKVEDVHPFPFVTSFHNAIHSWLMIILWTFNSRRTIHWYIQEEAPL